MAHVTLFKIKWLEGFRPDAFDIPAVEEFVGESSEIAVVPAEIDRGTDHRGIAVFHAIGVYIGIEACQESIGTIVVGWCLAKDSLCLPDDALYFFAEGGKGCIVTAGGERYPEGINFSVGVLYLPFPIAQRPDDGRAVHEILKVACLKGHGIIGRLQLRSDSPVPVFRDVEMNGDGCIVHSFQP